MIGGFSRSRRASSTSSRSTIEIRGPVKPLRLLALAVLAAALGGCSAQGPAGSGSGSTDSPGTAADYQVIVDSSEALLADALSQVAPEQILRSDIRVTDLETSQHRMLCGDTTSQYTNRVNLYLTPQTDEIAIIDAVRDRYVSEGWTRDLLGDGEADAAPDPEGAYIETLGSPDDYGLTLSRGEDTDGTTILQVIVYSPCIANPEDKPATWGVRARS